MEEIDLNRREHRKLQSSHPLVPNKKIYVKGNDLYKIYTFDKHLSILRPFCLQKINYS